MVDPLRTDTSRALDAASDSDRNAKIEQLLLDGLDCYFAARYEQAIDVWTRALFFDRNHARARAYIERARRALAERERESEELLQSGMAAFGRGESGEARRLLRDAIGRGAPPDEALAILGRLDRMDQRSAPVSGRAGGEERRRVRPPLFQSQPHPTSRSGALFVLVALVIACGVWLVTSSGIEWRAPFAPAPATGGAAPRSVQLDPAIPGRGEMALARARALVVSGRLHDAIVALELVRATDAQRPEADRLRAGLQRQLIALTLSTVSDPGDPVPPEDVVR
jgi:hypothetical protein